MSTAIGYLCLHIKSKFWQSPDQVMNNLATQHQGATPNMRVVKLMLKMYEAYQKMILDRLNAARRLTEAEKQRLERIRLQ